jgi:hypothetical protein
MTLHESGPGGAGVAAATAALVALADKEPPPAGTLDGLAEGAHPAAIATAATGARREAARRSERPGWRRGLAAVKLPSSTSSLMTTSIGTRLYRLRLHLAARR